MLIDWICRMLIVALGALVGTNEPIEKAPVETFLMLILWLVSGMVAQMLVQNF